MLNLPVRASHLALLLSSDEKLQERQHLITLCERFGVAPPEKKKWITLVPPLILFKYVGNNTASFSTYSFYVHDTPKDPFADSALKKVPVDWMSQLTGQVIVAAHATNCLRYWY